MSLAKLWPVCLSLNMLNQFSSAPPKFLEERYEDTIYLNVGQAKALEIPYSGNPYPKVTWSFNNGALPDKKRFKEETIYGMTCVRMSKVVRTDSGSYRVTLENDVGFCEYLIKVVVMGTYEAARTMYINVWSAKVLVQGTVIQFNGTCHLVDITGAITLVPCLVGKPVQLSRKSGTHRFKLRAPDLQLSCND